MGFSVFDRRLLDEGLAWFDQPRVTTLLEQLGTTRFERVERLTLMLRHGAPEEVDEAVALFERVLGRLERDEPAGGGRRRRESASERRARRYGR